MKSRLFSLRSDIIVVTIELVGGPMLGTKPILEMNS